MKIIVNHLTRLTPGYICVAGLNLENERHVRPVLGYKLLSTAFLADRDGYFGLGHVVDLGAVKYNGQVPETEDYCFEPGKAKKLTQAKPADFWQYLERTSQAHLSDIFGPDLHQHGPGAVVNEHCGQASLGNLRPAHAPRLWIDDRRTLRLDLSDGHFDLNLAVTDLRFYQNDHKTLKTGLIEQVSGWLEAGQPLIISLGLSRAWQKPGDTAKRHWLQANNLHFTDNLFWK